MSGAKAARNGRQIHVFYSGRVQGVGFRFTAETTAVALRLTGWVRNLRNGRVEAVLEGPEPKLHAFLQDMRTGPMANFIRDVEVTWGPATGAFDEFEIHYF